MKISPMLTFFTLIQLLFLISCSLEQRTHDSLDHSQSPVPENDKQRGAHVFGRIDTTDFQFLKQDHIEWVTLVPWGFQQSFVSPEVRYHRGDSSRIRRRNEHWLRQIQAIRRAGFKVFVKPHIWMVWTLMMEN